MRRFRVVLCGFKDTKLEQIGDDVHVVKGTEVTEEYEVEATDEEEAMDMAIEQFEEDGGYFDEVIRVEEVR